MSLAQAAQAEFKRQVEEFLNRTGVKHSRFGLEAAGDKSFVADMREGNREFRPGTIAKVETYMASYRAQPEKVVERDQVSGGL
jgi:hypothetical protein